ncbi:Protein YIPF1-like [Oopsacas minuta]|uniref:Protein YIPF1-like n=1 Tax=Oopsacas minuta TaxID=111878 RepID=A0AAV7JB46_9METZ|nr:Protein YIPF1-like [Oopsacas minuta]
MTDAFVELDQPQQAKEEEKPITTTSSKMFWKLEYYQQFFNVTTNDVGHRILSSMIPNRKGFIDVISSNPDLYGPLWVCITLIVTASMSGNIAKYFGNYGHSSWTFQFEEVTSLATILFVYTWIVPIVLWGVLAWRVGQSNTHSVFSMITLYGYSLSIYIPVSILWTVLIRFITIQWIITLLAAVLSGAVLAISFWPVIKRDRQKIAYGVIGAILLLHILLAVGFQLYFFRSVSSSSHPQQTILPTPFVTDNVNAIQIDTNNDKSVEIAMPDVVNMRNIPQQHEENEEPAPGENISDQGRAPSSKDIGTIMDHEGKQEVSRNANIDRGAHPNNSEKAEIQDLQVFENDIWISQGDPIQIRCTSLLHCTQLVKALSQLKLQSQISEILLEFGESSGGTADVIHDEKTSAEQVPDSEFTAISPSIEKQILSIESPQQELSTPVESTACITPDEHITQIMPLEEQQQIISEVIDNEEIVQIYSDTNNQTQELDKSSDQASGIVLDKDIKPLSEGGSTEYLDPPTIREEDSLTQQSIELEAVYSVGIIKNSFDENSLPFPKVSRIRKTQSLKDGDLTSNRSPKLVRKRSKKERSSGGREVRNLPRSRSECENEIVFEPSSELDPYSTDIFKDISMESERSSIQLDDSPISQHIPRSERKKKQKKRESKTEIQSTDTHLSKKTDSVIPQDGVSETVHSPDYNTDKVKESDLVELSKNNKIFEDFTLTSEQIWGDLESSEDDLSSNSQLISSWLSSFICLITSVPTSSLPGSHTITILSCLSTSSHFNTLQQLAISAMLSCCWQSISFPNPLIPTVSPASSDPSNFFFLQAPFLPISEVRCYLTQQYTLDRKRVYSLYSRGLQDFKEPISDLSSPELLDIESQSFPLQIHKDLQSGIELCVRKFPCILPWEIFSILFSNTESTHKLQSHPQSQIYLEYMEGLFLSVDEFAYNSSLLKTAFTTDHDSFIAWSCLSLQFLPTLNELSIDNNINLPRPNSHQLEWKYKRVWELIFNCNVIPTELAEECLAHFKQHCFWLGVISCYFMLNRKEEATVILLQLHDNSLLKQSNSAWAKYPNSLSDWKLTIHMFLSVFDAEFSHAAREDISDRISQILRLAVREIGCLSVIEILRDILPPLEKTTSIKTWFPYEILLKLVQISNVNKEKSKIAFHLLERLDEELWKQKPNAISLQFLLHENISSRKSSFTLETSGHQWGIRAKRNEFRCQSCFTDIMSPLPVLPSDIQMFACGHSYHKACLLEEACTLCLSESIV